MANFKSTWDIGSVLAVKGTSVIGRVVAVTFIAQSETVYALRKRDGDHITVHEYEVEHPPVDEPYEPLRVREA